MSGTPPSTITTLTLDARRLRGVVKGVPKLDWLSISADELDVPEWMGACRRWPSLTALDLSRTPVGDEVVDDLLAMDSLQYVGLVGTRVSDAGFVRLRAARPALRTRARRVP